MLNEDRFYRGQWVRPKYRASLSRSGPQYVLTLIKFKESFRSLLPV